MTDKPLPKAPDPLAALKAVLIEQAVGATPSPTLARFLDRSTDVDLSTGRPRLRVLDENGRARLNDDCDPMSVADLLAEVGAAPRVQAPASAASTGTLPPSPSSWTDDDRRAFIRQHGHDAFRRALVADMERRARDREADQRAQLRRTA